MITASFCDFLESSTIHGLAHISTAKSRTARAAWAAIVLVCFATAMYMITSSYKEWQESPVSTTITPHPITELEFPTVTVCPPRGSNTALNHLLEKVKDVDFTEEERQELLAISDEVFIEIPNQEYAKQMAELVSDDHMRSIVNGLARMPVVDETGMVTLVSFEPEGNFATPGFVDPDYKGDFYRRPQDLLYVLDLPDNIGEMVGEGALVISVENEGDWTWRQGDQFHLHREMLSHSDAENYCVSQGRHLPSVDSERQNEEINEVASGNLVWLGGRQSAEGEIWHWADGRTSAYQRFANDDCSSHPCCLRTGNVHWFSDECTRPLPFICATYPHRISGNHAMVLGKDLLKNPTFYFWWNHNPDSKDRKTRGFKFSWQVKNSSLPDVKKYDHIENNTNVLTLMKMVRESKRNNVDEKDLWKSLLKNRWNIETTKNSLLLNDVHEYDVILKTAKELGLGHDVDKWVPSEDLSFGIELFSIMEYPFQVAEEAKLSQFFRHLLTNHSLNTVVASSMRNLQPLAGDDVKNFTLINMWYERLDERYNFSLGSIILPLLGSENLTQLAKLDPLNLKDFKATIEKHQYGNNSIGFGELDFS